MATEIYCKSDCTFSQNSDRVCRLPEIRLQQLQREGARFVCQQYVQSPASSQRFNSIDVNISLNGVEKAMRSKLVS